MCIFALAAVPAAAAAGTAAAGTAAAVAGTAAATSSVMFTAANIAANVSLIGGVLGTATSLYGSYKQSKAAEASSKYQAALMRNQQQIGEYQATDALERSREAERQQRLQTRAIMGNQRATMAASGMSMDSGSFIDTLGDTSAAGELDALTIRSNGAKEAWGYRAQAAGSGNQAALYSAQAADTASSRPLQLGGSLLTAAGSVSDRWSRSNRG